MDILEGRNSDTAIEERFVNHVLRQQAVSIMRDSRREMRGFSQSKWRRAKMIVDKNELTYQHLGVHRFVDMKTRKTKTKIAATKKYKANRIVKKKAYPIHNKVIFSHKRFLIKQLSFGFTDSVKAQFRRLVEQNQ